MRRNDRETEIRMMTMEEYLKKRQAIRRRGNMGENECHEKTADEAGDVMADPVLQKVFIRYERIQHM